MNLSPMNEFFLQHSSSTVGKDEIESAWTVLESNFVGYGRVAKALENEFCSRTGKQFGFAVTSGFHAVTLALHSLDLPKSSIVSIPVLTCPSIVESVKGAGHRIGLTDIQLNDLTIDPSMIHKEAQAIIAPHAYGAPLNVIELGKLNLPWIEDCATSPATVACSRPAGSWGTIAVFSFNSTKYITAGAGGMVLTDDPVIADRIRFLLEPGNFSNFSNWMNPIPSGFPGYLSDVNASIALTQYKKMSMFMQCRRDIAEIYTDKLSGVEGLILPVCKVGHSYYRYIIHTHDPSEKIAHNLKLKGIDARTAVNPWLDMSNENESICGNFLNANFWKDHMLSLPIHPSMTVDQANFVADCLVRIVK